MRNLAEPKPSESAGRQSGHRVGHPAELADRRELAVLAHGPAEQLLRVGVDRVQVAAITGDRFVADALLALPGRGRYRITQPEAPIAGDLIARHRSVAEVRYIREAVILCQRDPAHLAAGVTDGAADHGQLASPGHRIGRSRRRSRRAAERLRDD